MRGFVNNLQYSGFEKKLNRKPLYQFLHKSSFLQWKVGSMNYAPFHAFASKAWHL